MNEQETIVDIVAEMRRNFADGNPYFAAGLPDRLEAAHNREMATAEKSSAVGNAAKLYEAVGYILKYADSAACRDHDEHTRHYIDQIRKWAQSALASPARNCDKYATADEALKAQEQMFNDSNFANGECKLGCPECDNPRVGCKIAWLFAPATEKEGGAK